MVLQLQTGHEAVREALTVVLQDFKVSAQAMVKGQAVANRFLAFTELLTLLLRKAMRTFMETRY